MKRGIVISLGLATIILAGCRSSGITPNSPHRPLTGEFVYIINAGSNTVSAYTINGTTGALTAVAGSPFAAGTEPLGVAVDPSGKFAYVANNRTNNVSAYTINTGTGALTPVAGSPFTAGLNTWGVAVAK